MIQRKLINVLIFLILGNSAAAQREKKTVIAVATLETQNFDYISLNLPFLSLEFSPENTNMFIKGGIAFKKGNFFGSVSGRVNYSENLDENGGKSINTKSIYKTVPSSSLNYGLRYIILKKSSEHLAKFKLKREYIGNTLYDLYGTLPVTAMSFITMDAGFTHGHRFILGKNKEFVFTGFENSRIAPKPNYMSTMMDYNVVHLGLSLGKMGYYKAEMENYGIKTDVVLNRLYAHVLFQTKNNLDSVAHLVSDDPNATIIKTYKKTAINSSPLNNWGLRIGLEYTNVMPFGISGSVELGFNPGIKGSSFGHNFYFGFNSQLSFAKIFKPRSETLPLTFGESLFNFDNLENEDE